MPAETPTTIYDRIIEALFLLRYKRGDERVEFRREDLHACARHLGLEPPKNLGDILYTFRYRRKLPRNSLDTAPPGKEWVIESTGRGRHVFHLRGEVKISASTRLAAVKIPDATPGIVSRYRLSDEQALLARVRYNRLIDIFTGTTCYSLQNHLRTTAAKIGQVEVDEIYLGVDRSGSQYVFPVQAKGGKEKLGMVQIRQDIVVCREKFPDLACRPIGAQFLMADGIIAMFEFDAAPDDIQAPIVAEKHYRLVQPEEISPADLARYRTALP